MGSGMARNLLRAGHEVTVYNRTRAKSEELAADGAKIGATSADACRNCDAVLTMLADDSAVEEVMFGKDGAVASLPRGATHLSCSTVSTAMARRLAAEHANRGQSYLSSPVFGRPEAAEAGKLLVVVAGAAPAIEKWRPVLDAIGRQTFVAGAEPWQANAVKLCGNFMLAGVLEAFGEAFATIRKAGVDPHLFLDTMSALFQSPVYTNYGRAIADEQFEPAGFALKLGLKDVRLALETAHECTSPMPMASLVRDQMLSAVAQGQADLDWSSLSRVAARNAGLDLPAPSATSAGRKPSHPVLAE
jgi:3-hydroxyisobutyrate dehydrogenase-like beta-hydroxyacid dehydrogenase